MPPVPTAPAAPALAVKLLFKVIPLVPFIVMFPALPPLPFVFPAAVAVPPVPPDVIKAELTDTPVGPVSVIDPPLPPIPPVLFAAFPVLFPGPPAPPLTVISEAIEIVVPALKTILDAVIPANVFAGVAGVKLIADEALTVILPPAFMVNVLCVVLVEAAVIGVLKVTFPVPVPPTKAVFMVTLLVTNSVTNAEA